MARIIRTNTEFQETASPAVVSWYSVVPALMATKDGGATPEAGIKQQLVRVKEWKKKPKQTNHINQSSNF